MNSKTFILSANYSICTHILLDIDISFTIAATFILFEAIHIVSYNNDSFVIGIPLYWYRWSCKIKTKYFRNSVILISP